MNVHTSLPPSATGSQERIRIQVVGQASRPILSGSITEFDFATGNFTALLDVQHKGAESIEFVSTVAPQGVVYVDKTYGLSWHIVQ